MRPFSVLVMISSFVLPAPRHEGQTGAVEAEQSRCWSNSAVRKLSRCTACTCMGDGAKRDSHNVHDGAPSRQRVAVHSRKQALRQRLEEVFRPLARQHQKHIQQSGNRRCSRHL